LSSFRFIIKQQWTIEEISIFRGEDVNVKVYDVWRTTSDGKSWPGLCPGEPKKN